MSAEKDNTQTSIQELSIKEELDARTLFCPEPVMMLHNKIRDIAVGEILKLIATDSSTTRDVPKFCVYLGHELLHSEQQGDEYIYLIRKSEAE